jgi:hypothetical protein
MLACWHADMRPVPPAHLEAGEDRHELGGGKGHFLPKFPSPRAQQRRPETALASAKMHLHRSPRVRHNTPLFQHPLGGPRGTTSTPRVYLVFTFDPSTPSSPRPRFSW